MTLAEVFEQKKEALRVGEVARILDVSNKQIYKMAANGQIPSLKIANCVRFDPSIFANWLRSRSMEGSGQMQQPAAVSSNSYLGARSRRKGNR